MRRRKILNWPYRLTVRTSPSQGGNQGSIPCRVTQWVLYQNIEIPYNVDFWCPEMYYIVMKKQVFPIEKVLSKKVVQANHASFENLKKYQKAIETIEKARFPFGKQVVYKQVGVNTTDLPIDIYGTITTG